MKKRRVVVTGLGVITPLGNSVQEFWEGLCAGRSGIGYITRFDTQDFPIKIAAEVKGFDPLQYIDKKEVKKMDTFIHYALAASEMAVQDAGIKLDDLDKDRAGVLIGSEAGGLPAIEEEHKLLLEKGPKRISPFFIPSLLINLASGQISIRFGFRGPNLAVATACAAGTHAIGDAFKIIQRGDADLMISGGTEAEITPLAIGGFNALKALSRRNEEPQKASRPFDRDRDGFVMGEGCGLLVLESLEHALKRNADIKAEIVGYGLTADAYHMTTPSPGGRGAAQCMKMALADAGLAPEEVDYINAHGTSTPLNDAIETAAIKAVFGKHAYRLAVSSTKSMIGHLLGAAGGVEAVATVLTIRNNLIPPTINYETPDPNCDLDYVPNKARPAEVNVALSNSFGFGGTIGCIVFKKFQQ
jgi:beta-ketoacyl-acyl-carrier-protein synthase II